MAELSAVGDAFTPRDIAIPVAAHRGRRSGHDGQHLPDRAVEHADLGLLTTLVVIPAIVLPILLRTRPRAAMQGQGVPAGGALVQDAAHQAGPSAVESVA